MKTIVGVCVYVYSPNPPHFSLMYGPPVVAYGSLTYISSIHKLNRL